MDKELLEFTKGVLLLDMTGTTEDDWRQLLADCERIGFNLDQAAQKWWGYNEKEEPFIEYEQQNIKGTHKNGGWELQFSHLECDGPNSIHSVRNPDKKYSVSYLELKKNAQPAPEFILDF